MGTKNSFLKPNCIIIIKYGDTLGENEREKYNFHSRNKREEEEKCEEKSEKLKVKKVVSFKSHVSFLRFISWNSYFSFSHILKPLNEFCKTKTYGNEFWSQLFWCHVMDCSKEERGSIRIRIRGSHTTETIHFKDEESEISKDIRTTWQAIT